MSDPFTEIVGPSAGMGDWGHLSRDIALALYQDYFTEQREEAEKALSDLEAGRVKVFHQYGPIAAKRRREVTS